MMREMTWRQFLEWRAYAAIEPFGENRQDWRIASLCSTVMNVALGQAGSSKRFQPRDFLLEFTDEAKPVPKVETGKSWQQMKLLAQIIATGANLEQTRRRR